MPNVITRIAVSPKPEEARREAMRAGPTSVNRKTSFPPGELFYGERRWTRQRVETGSDVMSDDSAGLAPTSSATTADTEPEVVAGIASGDLHPEQKLAIRVDPPTGWGRALLYLAGGLAVGGAIGFMLRGRPGCQ
jgi:hypothetical protein